MAAVMPVISEVSECLPALSIRDALHPMDQAAISVVSPCWEIRRGDAMSPVSSSTMTA